MRRLFLSWLIAIEVLACCAPAAAQSGPVLEVAPLRLLFNGDDRAERLGAQRVEIRNAGGGNLVWEAHTDAPWVLLAPQRGLAPGDLLVSIDARALRPGPHDAHVIIDAPNANGSPKTVVVQVMLASTQPPGPPALLVTPGRLTFDASPGQTQTVSSSLHLEAERQATVDWTARTDASWLTVAPPIGSTPADITVTAAPAPLGFGQHSATVFIRSSGQGDMLRLPVVVAVRATQGPLAFERTELPAAVANEQYSQALPIRGGRPPYTFRLAGSLPADLALENGVVAGVPKVPGRFEFTVIAADGSDPPVSVTQIFTLPVVIAGRRAALIVTPGVVSLAATVSGAANSVTVEVASGGPSRAWRVSADAPWLRIDPAGGEGTGRFTVRAATSAMKPGTYRASITVAMEGAENSPMRIPVELVIRQDQRN